jgi:N-acyl amino acid synthase of PEP-CTERM/exosortase system
LRRHFLQYFEVVPALTEDLIKESQKIRYEVYCKELGWEPENKDGLEKDSYDTHSLHCLLKNVKTGKFIGCIRLVLPSHDEQVAMLPFQKVCATGLNTGHPNPVELANDTTAEVSRLAIVSEYRRRKNEQGVPVAINNSDYGCDERRKFPYIPVGLYLGMLHMAFVQGIQNLYFLTEPHLARHFSRLGGKLEPVGDGVDHRGLRIPYRMNVREVLRGIHLLVRPLKKVIEQKVSAEMKV